MAEQILTIVIQNINFIPPWTLFTLSQVCKILSRVARERVSIFFNSVSLSVVSLHAARLNSHIPSVLAHSLEVIASMTRSPKASFCAVYLESRGWMSYICTLFNKFHDMEILLNILRIFKSTMKIRFIESSNWKFNIFPVFISISSKLVFMLLCPNNEIKLETLRVLPYFLDRQKGNQELMRSNCGIEILLDILKEQTNSLEYMALYNLYLLISSTSEENIARLARANNKIFFQIIIQLLQSKQTSVQELSCQIIIITCDTKEYCKNRFVKMGIANPLILLLYSPDTSVQKFACGALLSLIHNHKKAQKAMQGCIPHLVSLSHNHDWISFFASLCITSFSEFKYLHLHDDAVKSFLSFLLIDDEFAQPALLRILTILESGQIALRDLIAEKIEPILKDPQLKHFSQYPSTISKISKNLIDGPKKKNFFAS